MADSTLKNPSKILRTLFESMAGAIIVTNLKGEILETSVAAIPLIETSEEAVSEALIKLSPHISENSQEECTVYFDKVGATSLKPIKVSEESYIIWHVSPQERSHESGPEISKHVQKMASVGEMAASIVHEIRNPLTVITGQVSLGQEYLKKGPINESVSIKLFDRIEKSTKQLNGIIKSLLNFSRNTSLDESSYFSLKEVLSEVEVFSSLKTRGSKATVTISHPEKDVLLFGHQSELVQVLVNLVKNAKEENAGQQNAWVRVDVDARSDSIQLLVSDSGNGIPPEIVTKLFSPYFTTKPVGEGTGLGLSLCKKIIEEHMQGRLFVDSNHANTCFVLEIPIKQKEKKAS